MRKNLCLMCGQEFNSKSRAVLYCPICKRKEQKQEYDSFEKANEALLKTLREVEKYNLEHDINLSYGQYVGKRYLENESKNKSEQCDKQEAETSGK